MLQRESPPQSCRSDNAVFSEAMKLLDSRKAKEAEEIGQRLLLGESLEDKANGHFCLGLVYEFGGTDFTQNLERSLFHYRHLALITRDPLSYCLISRVALKMGKSRRHEALSNVNEARKLGDIPEIYICLGNYFREEGFFEMAKKNYIKAARMGRFQGFFEYSRVCRDQGHFLRSSAASVVRILMGPIYFLVFGKTASDVF